MRWLNIRRTEFDNYMKDRKLIRIAGDSMRMEFYFDDDKPPMMVRAGEEIFYYYISS